LFTLACSGVNQIFPRICWIFHRHLFRKVELIAQYTRQDLPGPAIFAQRRGAPGKFRRGQFS
jgi:hypothetical protein